MWLVNGSSGKFCSINERSNWNRIINLCGSTWSLIFPQWENKSCRFDQTFRPLDLIGMENFVHLDKASQRRKQSKIIYCIHLFKCWNVISLNWNNCIFFHKSVIFQPENGTSKITISEILNAASAKWRRWTKFANSRTKVLQVNSDKLLKSSPFLKCLPYFTIGKAHC